MAHIQVDVAHTQVDVAHTRTDGRMHLALADRPVRMAAFGDLFGVCAGQNPA